MKAIRPASLHSPSRSRVSKVLVTIASTSPGLSAGGATMAALLGDLFPDVYAAVGVHSGLAARARTDLSSGLAALRGAPREASIPREMPTIVCHGDRDVVVSPVNGTRV